MNLPQAIYLFADLVNSTGYKEQHRFDTGWQKIQDFINETLKIVKKHNGFLYRIMGDAVVVKLVYSESDGNEPFFRAINMAYDIFNEFDSFNNRNKFQNQPKESEKIEVKIGISFGSIKECLYDEKYNDDIGECIDEAARLSSITLPFTLMFPLSLRDYLKPCDCPLHNTKCPLLLQEVKKIKLKGKEKKEDYIIIGLEDIKRCAKFTKGKRCGNKASYNVHITVKNFLESRPLEDLAYIAFGGFMYSGKKMFSEELAKKIESSLKNTKVSRINDNNMSNPFLTSLNRCKEKDEHYEALATQTNLWYLYHHIDCVNKCFKSNKANGIFVSDFYLDYDLLYSDVDGANKDLVKYFYDITKKSANIYKEPDFVILLEAPREYYLEEAKRHFSDPNHINLENYMDRLIKKYELRFMEQNKRKYYKIRIDNIYKKDKTKAAQNLNEEINYIYKKLLEEGILYE